MAKVFISFLGIGSRDKTTGTYGYIPTEYTLNGAVSRKTPFIQAAELELLGPKRFDRIHFVTTEKAYGVHADELGRCLSGIGVSIGRESFTFLEEDMSASGQWKWFEATLGVVNRDDELTVDLTHGYRSIPIVFSTALNFLQRAKGVRIEAVLYGAFEMDRERPPIVDMKDFYLVNEWADAVGRLVEDADARKIAALAKTSYDYQVPGIRDEKVVKMLTLLTDTIRNVDVNSVAGVAQNVVSLISERKTGAAPVAAILLDLMLEKYSPLSSDEADTGAYDGKYFTIQLRLIELLIDHKLFMQAFTAMREFIGSIGMAGMENFRYSDREGREARRKYAEKFIAMVNYDESEWHFFNKSHFLYNCESERHVRELYPFYDRLKSLGIVDHLHSFVGELTRYRNGLDHAWTSRNGMLSDIAEKAGWFYTQLKSVTGVLIEKEVVRS